MKSAICNSSWLKLTILIYNLNINFKLEHIEYHIAETIKTDSNETMWT